MAVVLADGLSAVADEVEPATLRTRLALAPSRSPTSSTRHSATTLASLASAATKGGDEAG